MLIQVKKEFEYLVIYQIRGEVIVESFHQIHNAEEKANLTNGHIIKL